MKHEGELRVFTLGTLRLEREGKRVQMRRRKAGLLLVYLSVERAPQPREKLAALFWGESTDAQARLSLRVTLNALRDQVHPQLVFADRETVQLNSDVPLWTDAAELEELAQRIRELPVNGAPQAVDAALAALTGIYGGEFLAGEYQDWVLAERERLRGLYLDSLLYLTHLLRSAGEYERAIAAARQVLAHDRANEQAHQHLIVCLAASGDRTGALEQYEGAKSALEQELGVEPSAETRALVTRIKEQLRGSSSAAPLTNLPKPLTSFVGREMEAEEIRALLTGESAPIPVTLVGAGGSGKTRLAIEVGRMLVSEHADGVWWIGLASVERGSLVAETVAKVLGVRGDSSEPLTKQLLNYLRGRDVLLIFDNCEHLLAECAGFVQKLGQAGLRIQILATSREPLGVAGEQVYLVPTLAIPPAFEREWDDADDLMRYSAVQLLSERANQAARSFTLSADKAAFVAQICQQLDGIPLALEIAAARLKTMTVQELAASLDSRLQWVASAGSDASGRQRSLSALFDWSYVLLSPAERTLFSRLAVFRGGFELRAAVTIAYGGIEPTEPLDELGTTPLQIVEQLLTLLADKSLLLTYHTADGQRYEFLETIREYASEQLNATGQTQEIGVRHLAYFDTLIEAAQEKMFGPEQLEWLDKLELEHANVQAALRFSATRGARDVLVRMAARLGPFWQLRNYWSEGRAWLVEVLADVDDMPPSADLAKAYACAGVLGWLQGDYTHSLELHQTALDLYRFLEEPWGITNSLNNVALQYEALGQYGRARVLYDEALALARELEHPRLILRVLNNLCSIAYLLGDLPATEAFAEEALTRARAFGDKYALAIALVNRAQVAIAQGMLDDAFAYAREALNVANELGNREFAAEALRHQAMAYLKQGDAIQARQYFGECLRLAFELGAKRQITWALEGLALAASALGEWVVAARTFGAARALRDQISIPKDPAEAADHTALEATLREELGTEQYREELEAGTRRELGDAVKEALRTGEVGIGAKQSGGGEELPDAGQVNVAPAQDAGDA